MPNVGIKWFIELFLFSLATCIKISVFWMKINCKMNSLMVTSTKAVLISTGQQYTKQYCMAIQIRYRSCNVLVPNSGSRYQRYQMLVSVMKAVPFLYRHVYWVGHCMVTGLSVDSRIGSSVKSSLAPEPWNGVWSRCIHIFSSSA